MLCLCQCNEFGVISHEHICYYTYFTLEKVLEISGFKVLDCSLNESNGGSIRVLITHKDSIQKNYFNINQLLNASESYKSLSNIEARALIYQRSLIESDTEKKLEFLKQNE